MKNLFRRWPRRLESVKNVENISILIVTLSMWGLIFKTPLLNEGHTGWDTHDIGFVNFLYFSDSLRSGILPLWNHFIQAGTFFPNFNNIGLFFPLQLFFVALSWVLNPVYTYELMIQLVVLIGGVGSYLLFRFWAQDRMIALFGSMVFVSILVPILGQIGILISLSSIPWFIFICLKLFEYQDFEILRSVFLGTIGALYIVSGYPWMNFVNLSVAATFSLGIFAKQHRLAEPQKMKITRSNAVNLFLFFTTISLLYLSMELPGYLSLHFNYALFHGDYISPEPRLRSLNLNGQSYPFGSIKQALVNIVDPRIVSIGNSLWSLGVGWVLLIVFLMSPMKNHFVRQSFFLTLMIFALMYSAGNSNFVGAIARKIPFLNENRWLVLGSFYVEIFLVFIAVGKFPSLKGIPRNSTSHDFRALIIGLLSITLLIYDKSPQIEFYLVGASLVLVWFLGKTKDQARWFYILTALIGLNILSIVSIRNTDIGKHFSPDNGYSQAVALRKKEVIITKNFRRLGDGHNYNYNDERWLLGKIPFSHGYDNLGNPFYWYLKNDQFLSKLVWVTQNIRPETSLHRQTFASDNGFANAMMGEVLSDMSHPMIDSEHFQSVIPRSDFKWKLNDLDVGPNTAIIHLTINAPAFLIFNNVNSPGWDVYVNGVKSDRGITLWKCSESIIG